MNDKLKKQEIDDFYLIDDDDELDTYIDKYLLFHLGNEEYGIDIAQVTTIEELQKITEIPDMPEYVKGVINLRGKVIPVMDLRLKFGMEERVYDDRTCIIIVEIRDTTLGLIVDTVSEVHDINKDNIEPPPPFKSENDSEKYIAGLAKIGDEVKILLDAEKIIQDKERIKLAKPTEES